MAPKSLFNRSLGQINLIGLFLRGSSMLGKFLLLMSLTKFGSLADVGVYGIFLSSVLLLNYLQGLEAQSYTARMILAGPRDSRSSYVGNQVQMHLMGYILALPIGLMLFVTGVIDWRFCLVFFWILVSAHIGQEAYRLLVVFSKPTLAYLVSFLVHGLWAFIAIFYLATSEAPDLLWVFTLWGVTATIGVLTGLLFLKQQGCFEAGFFVINRKLLSDGFRTSYKYLLAALAYKTIDLSDRYFIQYYRGDDEVGVYTLYYGVSNIIHEVVFSGIVVLIFPSLLAAYANGKIENYQVQLTKLKRGIAFGSLFAIALVMLIVLLVSTYAGKEEILENYSTFLILVLSVLIVNATLVPHYVLYAHGKDRLIMWAAVSGACFNLLLNFLLIPMYGIFGAGMSTLASFILILVVKLRSAATLK